MGCGGGETMGDCREGRNYPLCRSFVSLFRFFPFFSLTRHTLVELPEGFASQPLTPLVPNRL